MRAAGALRGRRRDESTERDLRPTGWATPGEIDRLAAAMERREGPMTELRYWFLVHQYLTAAYFGEPQPHFGESIRWAIVDERGLSHYLVRRDRPEQVTA